MTIKLISKSEKQTISYATMLAGRLQAGDIVFLKGDLGAGKSIFARALIRTLAKNDNLEVPSPTFTLLQTYETPCGSLWHFDLYRLRNAEEIYELGWEEALSSGILLIEWPERLESLAPDNHLEIDFELSDTNNNERALNFTPPKAGDTNWESRLNAAFANFKSQ